jgi:hypothetical protein
MIVPLALLFLVVVGYLFPTYEAKLYEAVGEEVQILDVRMSYSQADVQIFFEKLGDAGGEAYRFLSGKIDMVYPLVYGFLLLFIIISLTKTYANSKWMLLGLIPLLATVLDYIENLSIAQLQLQFPNLASEKVAFASTMTSLKWGVVSVAFLILIVLGIIRMGQFMKSKRSH